MFGRRPDGRRVNDIDPVVKITPYVMPQRCDAQIFLKHRTDMELLASYIHKQADKGEKLGYMTILIAAYVRALSQNPCVNRFVMNKQLFARNNCTVSFNVLKDPYHIDKGELVCKTRFDLTDTIYDVRDRIEANIDALRGANAEEGFLEKLLNFGFAVPGLATFLVALIRLLDRYGLCPGALLNELPFHGSMYVTNVASIRLHEVNHHIYNFGNIGLFFSLGTAERIVTGPCARSASCPSASRQTNASAPARTTRTSSRTCAAACCIPNFWSSRRKRSSSTMTWNITKRNRKKPNERRFAADEKTASVQGAVFFRACCRLMPYYLPCFPFFPD